MLLNKNNLELQDYCAKTSGIRPAIEGIYITPEETVATDSMMLVQVSTPKTEGMEVSDFPQDTENPFKPKDVRTIIPAKLAKSVAKKLKPHNTLPILENAVIKNFKEEKKITFASTDLEVWEETSGNIIEDEYPKYKQIIPTGEPKAKVIINHKYLKSVLTALARTAKDTNEITVEIYGESQPIVLRSSNGHQETLALVMPIKA